MSIQGIEPSARPDWWQPYDKSRSAVKRQMKDLAKLRDHQDEKTQASIDTISREINLKIDQIYYLPLVSQKSLDEWIILLDANANIIGYMPIGGF